jgi:hypothetical protein
MTHFREVRSSTPSIGERFIHKTLQLLELFCASHSYFAPYLDKQCLLQTPERKNLRENEGARESLCLANSQETLCLERHGLDGRSEVVDSLTGKLFLQEYDAKQCPSSYLETCSPVTIS